MGGTNEREECAASLALQGGFLDITSRLLQASKDEGEREAQVRVTADALVVVTPCWLGSAGDRSVAARTACSTWICSPS